MLKIRSGVYQVMNELNGKSYVGSSANINRRWGKWRTDFKKNTINYRCYLWNAVQKYGVENFTFILLEECEPIKETLLAREQHYIDTIQPEYNFVPIAGSRLGAKQSPEAVAKTVESSQHHYEFRRGKTIEEIYGEETAAIARAKITEVAQIYGEMREGKTFDELFGNRADEIKQKMSDERKKSPVACAGWNKGIPMSEERKQEMSVIGKEMMTDEVRAKISESRQGIEPWNKGVPHTEEAKQKMSDAKIGKEPPNKGVPMSDEQRKKLSEIAKERLVPQHQQQMTEAARITNTGTPRSEETKQRISESNRTSEARKAYADSIRGLSRSPEVGDKVSASLKTSEKAAAYHESRRGKISKPSKSGHFGIGWRNDIGRWMVRLEGKKYGSFLTIEEAIKRRDEVMGGNI